jgi:DNA repair protein RadD
MQLRPYQSEAVEAAIDWIKKSVMPGLIEAATGSGKSHIIAAIAAWIYDNTGKKVLVMQPSKELTEQNWQKYTATGAKASIYSASAGAKCMRHPVIYATPQTVKNSLSRFGEEFGCVILDEAHGITPTVRMIIDSIRSKNQKLRVLGLSATPYRTTTGFIYQYDIDGSFVPEDQAREPYFNRLLYRIQTQKLIDMEFLTPAHADPEAIHDHYQAANLQLNSRGQFDQKEIERVFEGRGRLTAQIVADIVQHSRGRNGVMIFAATVQHAKEIMESLPPDNSRMLGGDVNMGKVDRERLVDDFKAMRFKYVVSVGTLTTGFDAPHVDVVAIMRATDSPGLLQQIIGRGLRLHPSKSDCLVLDYAENIDRFSLHDDLFRPTIRVKGSGIKGEGMIVTCPSCGFDNEFSGRLNPDNYDYSPDGYFLDPLGNPVETEHGPMPSHHGRRCTGQVKSGTDLGVYVRCEHRWTSKECLECGHANDVAARYCEACKAEIIDPNEKLQMEFARIKKDPYTPSTDRVLNWTANRTVTSSGNDALLCEYTTEYRTFSIWYNPSAKHPQAQHEWKSLNEAVFSGHVAPNIDMFLQYLSKGKPPTTVTAHRERGSKFYRIIAHNRPEDRLP